MSDSFPYVRKVVRAAAILTNDYVAGTVLGLARAFSHDDPIGYNQLNLRVSFTKGSLTTAEIKVEFSDDNVTWYQETAGAVTAGVQVDSLLVHQINATGYYDIPVQIAARYIRISANGTGTVTDSSMAIDAILSIR